MHLTTRILKLTVMVFLLGIMTVPAWSASEEKSPVIEPRARQVLQQAGDFMRSAQSFTFAMETSREIVMDTGQKIQYSGMHEMAVRKPDGVKVLSQGDLGDFALWYNGDSITIHNSEQNIYCSQESPDSIDAAFDGLAKEEGITPPMVSLLYSDPMELLMENVSSGFYVGKNAVRGVPSHHLAFTSEDMDTQIWVAAGLAPVILKAVFTNKAEKGAPQFTAYLSDWDLSPHLPDGLFKSILPKSALFCDFSRFKENDSVDK